MTETAWACRSCGGKARTPFVDLGAMPLANSLLRPEDLDQPEQLLPLRVYVCDACFLVQLQDFVLPQNIFRDYVYFSSFSGTWLDHASRYVDEISARLGLDQTSLVVEIGSNDGYLLRNFVGRGVPCLGIEPAENVAQAAREIGVPTECCFFGEETASKLARSRGQADLIIANNVLAHVPDLNDFIAGFQHLLASHGTVTVEAPHFLTLLRDAQFDTIYHEHYSYMSLLSVESAVGRHDLEVVRVEELPTHGGSLRYYFRRKRAGQIDGSVAVMREKEKEAGLERLETYRGFQERARQIKFDLLAFLLEVVRGDKTVAAYGAAAKGNTLLNFCGIDHDMISFVADRNPYKQGRFLPGSRIPVVGPEEVFAARPDFLLILPWNLKEEIMDEMSGIRNWGGRFVWAIPELEVT